MLASAQEANYLVSRCRRHITQLLALLLLLVSAAGAQVPTGQLAKPPADAEQFTILSVAGVHGKSALWTTADGTRMSRESVLLRGQVFELDQSAKFGPDGRAGVPIVAGTDGLGLELVRDLELHVQAGLTPFEALATATIAPAHLVGADPTGSIAVGKAADLILVYGDPSTHIGDLRNTRTVMLGGKLMNADALREATDSRAARIQPSRQQRLLSAGQSQTCAACVLGAPCALSLRHEPLQFPATEPSTKDAEGSSHRECAA